MDIEPKNAEATYVVGLCFYYKGKLEEAMEYFQEALIFDSKNTKAHQMIIKAKAILEKIYHGIEFYYSGAFLEAQAVYFEALQIDSSNKATNSYIYYNRAAAYLEMGSMCDAILECSRALEEDSQFVMALMLRARCQKGMKNFKECVKDYESAWLIEKTTEIERLLKQAQLLLKKSIGKELFKSGEFLKAQAVYTEALQIDPNNKDMNSKLYYNRALVNWKIGEIRDAVQDCTNALVLNSKHLKALLLRARCQYDMKNFEKCVEDYEKALKIEKSKKTERLLKEAKIALKKSKRKSYYEILGIDKNATETEIKKAYKKQALAHHPDKHANGTKEKIREQEELFKDILEAYTKLMDSQKSSRYYQDY